MDARASANGRVPLNRGLRSHGGLYKLLATETVPLKSGLIVHKNDPTTLRLEPHRHAT